MRQISKMLMEMQMDANRLKAECEATKAKLGTRVSYKMWPPTHVYVNATVLYASDRCDVCR